MEVGDLDKSNKTRFNVKKWKLTHIINMHWGDVQATKLRQEKSL